MDADALRANLAACLKASDRGNLNKLGEVVAAEACWGAMVEAFEQLCRDDADYFALLDRLIELGDARALLLFMSAARSRQCVLCRLLERADELPRTAQCALVSLPECEGLLTELAPGACAAARELAMDDEKRGASQPVYASHIGALRSMRWGRAAEGVQ